jgi:hypothetical protein
MSAFAKFSEAIQTSKAIQKRITQLPQLNLHSTFPRRLCQSLPTKDSGLTLGRGRLDVMSRDKFEVALSTGSSRFQLANGQGRTTQPLRSGPITGPSTPLRAAPPLRSASVLSPSRLEPLAASPFAPSARQSTGSDVPYESLVELRAAYMPDVARAVSGIPRVDPGGRVTPRF